MPMLRPMPIRVLADAATARPQSAAIEETSDSFMVEKVTLQDDLRADRVSAGCLRSRGTYHAPKCFVRRALKMGNPVLTRHHFGMRRRAAAQVPVARDPAMGGRIIA